MKICSVYTDFSLSNKSGIETRILENMDRFSVDITIRAVENPRLSGCLNSYFESLPRISVYKIFSYQMTHLQAILRLLQNFYLGIYTVYEPFLSLWRTLYWCKINEGNPKIGIIHIVHHATQHQLGRDSSLFSRNDRSIRPNTGALPGTTIGGLDSL